MVYKPFRIILQVDTDMWTDIEGIEGSWRRKIYNFYPTIQLCVPKLHEIDEYTT